MTTDSGAPGQEPGEEGIGGTALNSAITHLSRQSTTRKITLVVVPVIAAGLVLAAWQIKSIDIPFVSATRSGASNDNTVGTASRRTSLQRCVALWNRPSNDYGRQLISGYSNQAPYVNVNFSSTFPDRCLITAASPDLGIAHQFIQGGQGGQQLGPFGLPVSEGSVTSLPRGLTDWNATSDQDGYLTIGR